MALDFRLRDFAHPVAILRLHRELERTQYATPSELRAWQSRRLEAVLDEAFLHVPFYRERLRDLGLRRQDFSGPEDLRKLPVLERREIVGSAFVSERRARRRAGWVTTSGTSGAQLRLLMDEAANVLEFAHYWRHWGWAGYRLGEPFAELSTVAFLREPGLIRYQRLTGRLLLNSATLSDESVRRQWSAIRDARPRFIKGLASVLYHFASFVRAAGLGSHRFTAAFSGAETLMPFQRRLIEEVFDCKVYDSYGQMERLVAISECPHGRMHVNADYGLLEFEPSGGAGSPDGSARMAGMVGTGLHNLAMPLLRYRIEDIIELPTVGGRCPCGRTLPVVGRIQGRHSDVIRTPDGRVVTALFLAFEDIPGVRCGRVVEEAPGRFLVRVVPEAGFDLEARATLVGRLRAWLGPAPTLELELCEEGELLPVAGRKLRPLAHHISTSARCSTLSRGTRSRT